MRKLPLLLTVIFLITGLLAPALHAAGTADQAKALVEKAAAYHKANGKDKAIAAFNNPKGEFVQGDLYIFMMDENCNTLAHGANAKLVGKNVAELKDADGKLFMQAMRDTAKKGGGWVDYKWSNPATKKVQAKSSYIMPLGDGLFIGCGIYK
ncbi:MAG: cache domain-containing protein [Syntrophales bacterium]|nr:cache domain-containing protein [Syntrophales bacterium]MDD5642685.1 cache domain-containing protein [Syntrophales bacterium]